MSLSVNLPPEIQNTDTLHSYALNPVSTQASDHFLSWLAGFDPMEMVRNFWLVLPDYLVAIVLRIFSFSFFLSLLLIFVIVWAAHNLMKLRQKMHDDLSLPNQAKARQEEPASAPVIIVNEKWLKVEEHLRSANPSDWKLAILECDIILGDILDKMGYTQPSISEKLKSVEPSDFTTIENAWEAHKIRNQIAHEGSDFLINEREARRVVGLYETVFREFEYI